MGRDARGHVAIAESWLEYEETILPAVAEELSPATRGLVQMAFYCGARSTLELVGRALDGASSEQALEVTLERLCDEIDGFLEAGEGELN